MCLSLCEIVIAIQRIEPQIQEKARKVAIPKYKAARVQILAVLRQDQVDILLFHVREGPDDAIRRHDGDIFQHQGSEATLIEEVGLERAGRVHYKRVRAEVEEVC